MSHACCSAAGASSICESAPRALILSGIDGLCGPLPAITMRLLAISTRRVRPGWSVRLSLIVTHP